MSKSQSPRVIMWLKTLNDFTGLEWKFHTRGERKMCSVNTESFSSHEKMIAFLPELLRKKCMYYWNVDESILYEEDLHTYFGRGRELSEQLGIL